MQSRNKPALLALTVALCTAAGHFECPPALPQDASHRLVNASLFDGPPEQLADLVPERAASVDRWDLDGVDPYLVCRYGATARTIVLRPRGARLCEAGGRPFRAGCR